MAVPYVSPAQGAIANSAGIAATGDTHREFDGD